MSDRPSWLPKAKLPAKRTPAPRAPAPSYEREAALGLGGQSWGQGASPAAVGGPSWYADPSQGAPNFGSGALGLGGQSYGQGASSFGSAALELGGQSYGQGASSFGSGALGLGRPSSLWAAQPGEENWGSAAAPPPAARAPSFLPQAKLKPKVAAPSRPAVVQQVAPSQGAPSWLRQAKPRAPPAPKVFSAQLDDRFNYEGEEGVEPAGEVSAIHGSSGLAADPSGSAVPSSGVAVRSSGSVAAQMAAAKARLAARSPASGQPSGVAQPRGSVGAQLAAAKARVAARSPAAASSGSAAASSGAAPAQSAPASRPAPAARPAPVAEAADAPDADLPWNKTEEKVVEVSAPAAGSEAGSRAADILAMIRTRQAK